MICCGPSREYDFYKIRSCVKNANGVVKEWHSIRQGSQLYEGRVFTYPAGTDGKSGCHEVWEKYNNEPTDIEIDNNPLEDILPCADPFACANSAVLMCSEYNPCGDPGTSIWLGIHEGGGLHEKIYDYDLKQCLVRGSATKLWTEAEPDPCRISKDFEEIVDCDDILCQYAVILDPCDGSSSIYAEEDSAFVKDDVVRITLHSEQKCYTVGGLIRSSALSNETIHDNLSPSSTDSDGNDLSCEDYPCVPPETYRKLIKCSDDSSDVIYVKDSNEPSDFTEDSLLFISSEESCFQVEDQVSEPDIPSGADKRDSVQSELLDFDCVSAKLDYKEPCVDFVREFDPCDDAVDKFYAYDSIKYLESDYNGLEDKIVMLSIEGEESCHKVGERYPKLSSYTVKVVAIVHQPDGSEELDCNEPPCVEKILKLIKCPNPNDLNAPEVIIYVKKESYPDFKNGDVYRDDPTKTCYTVGGELIKTDQSVDESRSFSLREDCDKCDDPPLWVEYIECTGDLIVPSKKSETDTFFIDANDVAYEPEAPAFVISTKNGDRTSPPRFNPSGNSVGKKCFFKNSLIQSYNPSPNNPDRIWDQATWNSAISSPIDDYEKNPYSFCESEECSFGAKFVPTCPSSSNSFSEGKTLKIKLSFQKVTSLNLDPSGSVNKVFGSFTDESSNLDLESLYNQSISVPFNNPLINFEDLSSNNNFDLIKAKTEIQSGNPSLVEGWVKDIDVDVEELDNSGNWITSTISPADFIQSFNYDSKKYTLSLSLKDLRKPFWTDFSGHRFGDGDHDSVGDTYIFNDPPNSKGCFELAELKSLKEAKEEDSYKSNVEPIESIDDDPCENYCSTPTMTATPFPDLADCPDDPYPTPDGPVYIRHLHDFEVVCESFNTECPKLENGNPPYGTYWLQDAITGFNLDVDANFLYRGDPNGSGVFIARPSGERDPESPGKGIKKFDPNDNVEYESYEWRQINYEFTEDEQGKITYKNSHPCKEAPPVPAGKLTGIYLSTTATQYTDGKAQDKWKEVKIERSGTDGDQGFVVKYKETIFKIQKSFHKRDHLKACIMGKPKGLGLTVDGLDPFDRSKYPLPSELYLSNCHLHPEVSGFRADILDPGELGYKPWKFEKGILINQANLVDDPRVVDICWTKKINGVSYAADKPDGFEETTLSKAWTSFADPEGGLVQLKVEQPKTIIDMWEGFSNTKVFKDFMEFVIEYQNPSNEEPADLCCEEPYCAEGSRTEPGSGLDAYNENIMKLFHDEYNWSE
jgi:hypothetical protein